MSFRYTHNPYSTLTQTSIPHSSVASLCLPPQFPHTSVTWYPWQRFSQRPKAKRFSPAGTTWPHTARLAPPGPWPLVFRRSCSLTQMFSVGTFVFSLQTELILRAAPSLETLCFTTFTQLLSFFFFFFFIYCKECSGNPTWTRRLYFTRKLEGELGIPAWIALFKGSRLNMVWRDMLLKCKCSCSCRLGSGFDWKQRSWTPRCYLEVEI